VTTWARTGPQLRVGVTACALWLGCASGCATTSPPPDVEPPAAGTFHTVRPGETVWDLARRHGLSVEEIVEVNGLPSADEVAAGQVLFLPAGGRVDDDDRERAPDDAAARTVDVDVLPPTGSTPLAWPVDGVVLRAFSAAKGTRPGHDGLLVAAPADTPVRAAADGEVVFAGDQGTDYGVLVVLRHADDVVTVYGHLDALLVKQGDVVKAGQRIASVGTSGGAESPRLHFQARRGRTPVDPMPLLPP
jgi:lipoprotein NlpD